MTGSDSRIGWGGPKTAPREGPLSGDFYQIIIGQKLGDLIAVSEVEHVFDRQFTQGVFVACGDQCGVVHILKQIDATKMIGPEIALIKAHFL